MYEFWRLNRMLFMPACRTYARHAATKTASDRIMPFLSSLEFLMVHHYWPNFAKPQTFSEKIWRRMLFDRNQQLILLSDKWRMRSYVASKAASEYLVPLLWQGDDPDLIPFDELPLKFAAKATHGRDYNLLVQNKKMVDPAKARLQLSKWLKTNYGETFGLGTEWCYRHIRPSIIIEEFLEEDGKYVADYKFWCFSGRVECLTIHLNRHERHITRTFNRNFEPYRFPFPLNDSGQKICRPSCFDEMVCLAENLTSDIDFMRVDMYNIRGRIMVGEFAVYPGGGFIRFIPPELDAMLGSMWHVSL
jgi:hypothetical protein